MGTNILRASRSVVFALAAQQHGVVTRAQLLALGMSSAAIQHRLECGRLHQIHRGVYAVGRPHLTREGKWMAAVLACGAGAALSHRSAAALLRLLPWVPEIAVTVPESRRVVRPGITIHRRWAALVDEETECLRIPVTGPIQTLIDVAPGIPVALLEDAVNAADRRDLATPEQIRRTLDAADGRQPGVAIVRDLLDLRTFTLTDSHLERLFRPIARRAGLPAPLTRQWVNGFRVDFYWPDLGLVVETDGLRYHRTPSQQARDRRRDQAHTAAGLTGLRFTRAQVAYEADHVESTLRRTARLLGRPRAA